MQGMYGIRLTYFKTVFWLVGEGNFISAKKQQHLRASAGSKYIATCAVTRARMTQSCLVLKPAQLFAKPWAGKPKEVKNRGHALQGINFWVVSAMWGREKCSLVLWDGKTGKSGGGESCCRDLWCCRALSWDP